MNQPATTPDNPMMKIGLLLGGLVLMALGVQQMLAGWHKRPLGLEDGRVDLPVVDMTQEAPLDRFQLSFDGSLNRWVMASTSGRLEAPLPAGLPQPPAFEVPARAMPTNQWLTFFQEALSSGELSLNPATQNALRDFEIQNEKPFRNLKTNNLNVEDKVIKKPIASVVIPAEFNPQTGVFKSDMLAWQREVQRGLRASKVEREGYRVNSRHPRFGNRTALMFSSIARSRVLSGDFGRKRQDILIYLQVLCNFHQVYLKVDGVTGPQTRKSVKDFAFLVMPDDRVRVKYLQSLNPWVGS